MSDASVLVAYASQTGSTAAIATTIAAELRAAGLAVDCRPASDVRDLTGYGAIVLGSGVFLARRMSDGGGFIARHGTALGDRPVWLFAAGPIGRGRAGEDGTPEDIGVMHVARGIGARGAATFGAIDPSAGIDPLDRLEPTNQARVRGWARAIAADLAASEPSTAPERRVAHA
jgi:menaquinone-dependent protoporphyrinogen oxidase